MAHGYWGPAFDRRGDRRALDARAGELARRGCTRRTIADERGALRRGRPRASPTGRSSAGSRDAWSGARARSATAASSPIRAAPTCARSSTRRSSSARSSGRSRRRSLEEALDDYFVGRGARSVHDAGLPGAAGQARRHSRRSRTSTDRAGCRRSAARRTRCYWALIKAFERLHRRADAAQHVVQRERADRATARRGARLLPAHAHGRARARSVSR